MIATLAFRHLLVRKLRTLFLLLGFALGVGVMIVLLSVGQAMLDQSRDVALVGGGELTILPLGIDIEAMRTGGIGAMFFGIDRARFLVREVLGGPRRADVVRTVSPNIEGKLLYLRHGRQVIPVRAGGEIPSRAAAVGTGLRLAAGSWQDSPADSSFVAPSPQQLYDEIDRLHLPRTPDSTWAEWHYFNVVSSPDEWWYLTFLIGGEVPVGRWGGQLLLTHRKPDGSYQRYTSLFPAADIAFDTAHADLGLAANFVRQRDGVYRLHARSTINRVDLALEITPAPRHYFPPVELGDEQLVSGYVVPALVAKASGTICVRTRCQTLTKVPAYHDHNWGVWRDVTWEWGSARGGQLSLLYGGVYGPSGNSGNPVRSPFFLTVLDSLGVEQVLRFDTIRYSGTRRAAGAAGTTAPARFSLDAIREADTLHLNVQVEDALATSRGTSRLQRVFLQMRGHFALSGRLLGRTVADTGSGFFETYVRPRKAASSAAYSGSPGSLADSELVRSH
jgi:hypothetical protein